MAVSCVFKKLQDEDDDTLKELEEMNDVEDDEELKNDPILKLGELVF